MEEKPAGKLTVKNEIMDSPSKRSNNPIGSQSQWSFGWQGNPRDVVNRQNNSQGTTMSIQGSIFTTTRAASHSGVKKKHGNKHSKRKIQPKVPGKRKNLSMIDLFGTTIPRQQVKQQ